VKNIHETDESPEFSLALGGPLFQLLLKLGLITPTLDLLKRRIIVITLLAWLPLLLLSILDGKAWGNVGLPFLFDVEAETRLALALPLLIFGELLIHRRIRVIVGQFIERDIITGTERNKFNQSIMTAMKLRNSVTAEVIMIALVFVVGHYLSNTVSVVEELAPSTGSWYATSERGAFSLSLAGYWYYFVSRPLFQFLLLRWYFRLFIWARFLWQVSRLHLNLIPTHPDKAGGLGFLSMTSSATYPLILAHGVMLAALIANAIFFAGNQLTDFILLIAGFVLFVQLIILGPLLAFSDSLMQAKRAGLREYGILASQYVGDFDSKWVQGGALKGDKLLGNSDFQSLADLAHSFNVVEDIKPVPFSKESVVYVTALVIAPVLPLVLTMIPLEELIKKIFVTIF